MLKRAFLLWQQEKHKKGTSLYRRLIAFFALIGISIVLSFTALLLLLDITGSGRNTVYSYLNNELAHLRSAVDTNLSRLSVQGVSFAERAASSADIFFRAHDIQASELAAHPELLEPLLSGQMPALLSAMERNTCSGVFVLLDATIKPEADKAALAKAGIFIKKIQSGFSQAVGTKLYYLRGPAQIARDNGIELIGQWRMEYDITDEQFFSAVMETARQNPNKELSRLYYWTGRVTLKDNSESGFLLCVPLRATDGTVFGVCGMEFSDRLFKLLHSPGSSDYVNVFAAAAPSDQTTLFIQNGLLAGNYYLTGSRMKSDLAITSGKNGFYSYMAGAAAYNAAYGGLHSPLRLYPSGSVYETENWSVAVMMPAHLLQEAVSGHTPYLLAIVLILIAASLGAAVFSSRRYLRPLNDALQAIKTKSYVAATSNTYLEINDLMEFLALQDEQAKNNRPAPPGPAGDTTPMFEEFLKNTKTLSPAERSVFDLYIKGHTAQEIAEKLYLSINTIKTHNRRIFTKLNVSSRNELLVYIKMMKEMNILNHDPS